MAVERMPAVDLYVAGSVAVTKRGERCGAGDGAADLTYGVLRELGHPPMPMATTVHPLQIVSLFPVYEHDIPLSLIATPEGLLEFPKAGPYPREIFWRQLPPERLGDMPILAELRARRRR